jgi:hypothetical protein
MGHLTQLMILCSCVLFCVATQANPTLPVVQRLEDMWLLSKLQQERKAKQQQQQQQQQQRRSELQQTRQAAQQRQPRTPAVPSSMIRPAPVVMKDRSLEEQAEAADAAVAVLEKHNPAGAEDAVDSNAHGTGCCSSIATAAPVNVTAPAVAEATGGVGCTASAAVVGGTATCGSLVAELAYSRLYELD